LNVCRLSSSNSWSNLKSLLWLTDIENSEVRWEYVVFVNCGKQPKMSNSKATNNSERSPFEVDVSLSLIKQESKGKNSAWRKSSICHWNVKELLMTSIEDSHLG
jgi:hypothetical protein